MVDKKILELRNARKAKKPDFVRQEAWRRPKLTIKWRQPKGGQSKLRKKYLLNMISQHHFNTYHI